MLINFKSLSPISANEMKTTTLGIFSTIRRRNVRRYIENSAHAVELTRLKDRSAERDFKLYIE